MITTKIPLELLYWLPQGGDGTSDVETTSKEDTDGQETETTDDTESDDASSGTISKVEFDALQKKFEAMKNQLSAADRNKSDAQKKLEELQRKERTELENAQADAKKFKEEGEGWKTKFLGLAKTNAFLIASAQASVSWHDPEVAKAAAALDDLDVSDEGTVDGIEQRVKELVKKKPFLVKPTTEDTEDTEDQGPPKSGSRLGGKKKNQGAPKGLTPEELRKRFPALRL